jgi:hypothetical protein
MPAGPTPDDELGERLGRALHDHLGDDRGAPVDLPALIEGSRGRARQLRQRRIGLAVAGAVLVVAVPLAAEVISSPQASPPAAVISSAAPAPLLPGSLAFTSAELPAGLTEQPVPEPAAGLPLVTGLACPERAPGGARPRIARQWSWGQAAAGRAGVRVTLTVSDWDRSAAAAAAVNDLAAGSGPCRFSPQPASSSGALPAGAQLWTTTALQGSGSVSWAVVRVGGLVAGIEVRDPRSRTAGDLTGVLAGVAAKRLSARTAGHT